MAVGVKSAQPPVGSRVRPRVPNRDLDMFMIYEKKWDKSRSSPDFLSDTSTARSEHAQMYNLITELDGA